MNIVQTIFKNISWVELAGTGLRLCLILAVTFIGMVIIKKGLVRFENHLIKQSIEEGEPPSESRKRIETILRLMRQIMYLILWLTAGLLILKELGIAIGPVIASAGVAGLAVGFGAQNLVRDMISGFFLILENQIRVGDVAIINGTGGLVERMNLRTTILRDLGGVVHVFPNGSINTLSNLTNEWSAYIFDIGVAYKENTDRVVDIMHQVGEKMKQDDTFGRFMLDSPEIFGVDKFGESSVVIKGRIKTKPIRQWEVGREFLRRIKLAFDENNIEIPFPHRSVYFGENSRAFNFSMLENKDQLKN